ncbi:MAG: hypothetical protein V4813_04435 [Gemmatimonadota bacterium]
MADPTRSLPRGQSFLGLLLVLLVLTLLTAYAATRVDLTRYRSDAMARQAAAVFTTAARAARQQRLDVLVKVDSAGRRVSALHDRNGNGRMDAGESELWTALDAATDIVDPPQPLPGRTGASDRVVFRRAGGATSDFVLYLTSDANTPTAWRAVHIARRTAVVQVWRFDGIRWARTRT